MYNELHRRLTFLFTGIAGAILIAMSLIYLYMSEKELNDNRFLSFSAEANTIISNLEQQDTLTQEWLAKTAANQNVLLAFYDNSIPISYSRLVLSTEELTLADTVQQYAAKNYPLAESGSEYSSPHREFTCTTEKGEDYYVSIFDIRKNSGTLTGVILSSKEPLNHQIFVQKIRFFLMNIAGILLLLLFSWYYTGKLLDPILKSRQKQAAFVAAASHELRTPLAVILSSLSAAKSTEGTQKEHFFHIIEEESKRMSTLVNDMLTLTRADTGQFSLHLEPVELDTLLLNTCEAFEPLARKQNVILHITLPDAPVPRCFCDKQRIRQVLEILLSNALSYGADGKYITLSLTYSRNYFQIIVEDRGKGIADADKPYIFDRFYRGDTSRSGKDHFGLGLGIAKELITAHGGSITAGDTPGGGAAFYLKIPDI